MKKTSTILSDCFWSIAIPFLTAFGWFWSQGLSENIFAQESRSGHDFGLGTILIGWFWAIGWAWFGLTRFPPMTALRMKSRISSVLVSLTAFPVGLVLAARLMHDPPRPMEPGGMLLKNTFFYFGLFGSLPEGRKGMGELHAAFFLAIWLVAFVCLSLHVAFIRSRESSSRPDESVKSGRV